MVDLKPAVAEWRRYLDDLHSTDWLDMDDIKAMLDRIAEGFGPYGRERHEMKKLRENKALGDS